MWGAHILILLMSWFEKSWCKNYKQLCNIELQDLPLLHLRPIAYLDLNKKLPPPLSRLKSHLNLAEHLRTSSPIAEGTTTALG